LADKRLGLLINFGDALIKNGITEWLMDLRNEILASLRLCVILP